MSYERQIIDCNCNDCIFLTRDIPKFNKSVELHQVWAVNYAESIKANYKEKADKLQRQINDAINIGDKVLAKKYQVRKDNFLKLRSKVRPQQITKKDVAIHYGYCSRLKKDVSFIPNTIQIETQDCFSHRKDY